MTLHNFASRKVPFRVLIDMDCTICDFETYFLSSYRTKFPHLPYIPLSERRTFYLTDQYNALGEKMRVWKLM